MLVITNGMGRCASIHYTSETAPRFSFASPQDAHSMRTESPIKLFPVWPIHVLARLLPLVHTVTRLHSSAVRWEPQGARLVLSNAS